MIWQSLLHPRESIACIYNDIFIGLAKGIQAEGAISEELKVKWKEESEEKIRTLYAQWEKPQQAERAQKEYVAVQKDIDVFPAPVMMEPIPIKAATLSPAGIKQIQLDLAEAHGQMGERGWGLLQSDLFKKTGPQVPVGAEREGNYSR